MHHFFTKAVAALTAAAITLLPAASAFAGDNDDFPTATPIKHIVVIFQENVSFDHYFGTYPHATNPAGEPAFHAKDDTPRVNSLESAGLLTNNPNVTNPFRIDRRNAVTCDEDHGYADEEFAFDGGLMDRFIKLSCNDVAKNGIPGLGPNSTFGYFDGNTVTALWNYAQHFAMSDNSFGTTFGPSTPGLLNLVAGNTFEGTIMNGKPGKNNIAGGGNVGAVIGDPDPFGDVCSAAGRAQISMSGQSIGDVLTAAGITWGSFMGGFALNVTNNDGSTGCARSSTGLSGKTADYIPHHAFFQYWASTLNANHTRPASVAMIGHNGDAANHEYDLIDFWAAVKAHNMPSVSFLKAPAIQDGHAGYSNPLDEQTFLVNTINALQKNDEWSETAVIVLYDDSDGWYDHVMGPIVNQSNVTDDQLLLTLVNGVASPTCGTPSTKQVGGVDQNGRCGYGPRLPFLVISPFAKRNYIDHRVTDQSSIIRFVEDNWRVSRVGGGSTDAIAGTLNGLFDFDDRGSTRQLILDPSTGQVVETGSN
jgi:phospholipase C